MTKSLGLYALVGENGKDLERRFDQLRERSPGAVLDGVSLQDWRQGRLVGTVEEVGEQLAGWQDLGVGSLVMSLAAVPFSIVDDDAVELAAAASTLVPR